MTERHKATEAVFVAIIDHGKVLLQERKNTGWLDGWFDLPSGHVDPKETFLLAGARELEEEAGIRVLPSDLELFHVSQSDAGANGTYTYLMFRARRWDGVPRTNDPDRVGELGFYDLKALPEKTAPYVKRALQDITSPKVTFAYFGADSHG